MAARPTHVLVFESFVEGRGGAGKRWLQSRGLARTARFPHNLGSALGSEGQANDEESSAWVEVWELARPRN